MLFFYLLLSSQVCPENSREIPTKSADLSTILSPKIPQNLTFFQRIIRSPVYVYPANWNFSDCYDDRYPFTHWKLSNGHSHTFTKPCFSQLAYTLCSFTFLWVASPSFGHPFCIPRVSTYRSFHCTLNCKGSGKCFDDRIFTYIQYAKKVVSDSQGLWVLQLG